MPAVRIYFWNVARPGGSLAACETGFPARYRTVQAGFPVPVKVAENHGICRLAISKRRS